MTKKEQLIKKLFKNHFYWYYNKDNFMQIMTEFVKDLSIEQPNVDSIMEDIRNNRRRIIVMLKDFEWPQYEFNHYIIREILQSHLTSKAPTAEIDENTSDWYHTFKELYEHRIALYIAFVNESLNYDCSYKWHKSKLHFDWTWYEWRFIVMWYLGWRQISYHLPIDKWDMVHCKIKDRADKWDWHTPQDVVNILLGGKIEPQEKTDMEKCIEEVRNVRINREQEVKVDKVVEIDDIVECPFCKGQWVRATKVRLDG